MSRSIIFNEIEVRAILKGHKTQFRQPVYGSGWDPNKGVFSGVATNTQRRIGTQAFFTMGQDLNIGTQFPFGMIGDEIWVKEKHARLEKDNRMTKPHYFADGGLSLRDRHDAGLLRCYNAHSMPKWASRLTIKITSVRVEKLQDISIDDIYNEGLVGITDNRIGLSFGKPMTDNLHQEFAKIWDESSNAKHGSTWDSNPYVWVVNFEVARLIR